METNEKTKGLIEKFTNLKDKEIKNNYWEWSDEDFKTFKEEDILDHGKWMFFKAPDGRFEAVMQGLYMHVFETFKDLQMRENEIDFYEYDDKATDLAGETTGVNKNGETRAF